jgi:hypothetical protein
MMGVTRRLLQVQRFRSVFSAATVWKDVLENPYYDKYKQKLEKVQG